MNNFTEEHKVLDKIVADYIEDTNKALSNSTVMDLVKWSSDRCSKDWWKSDKN